MSMLGKGNRQIFRTAWFAALVAGFAGCVAGGENRVVQPGDKIGVRFTCRLPDGLIASSTEKSVAEDPALKKSPIFLASRTDEPVTLPSGTELAELRAKPVRAMEEEIMSMLADSVAGMRVGESRRMNLAAEPAAAAEKKSTSIEMARVRVRPREARMTLDEYRARRAKAPVVGDGYTVDPAFPGKVTEVADNGVVVVFSAPSGNTVETPFGAGTVREKDDRYEVEIDARQGRLVRSGPLVGRISSVDDRRFIVDYGNPFGGEELSCDVTVATAERPVPTPVKKESVLPGAGAASGGLPAGETEAMMARLSAAVQDAVKQGKDRVDLDLGDPTAVSNGDLVIANYTASLEDGSVFATTMASTAGDPAVKKVSWYSPPDAFGAVEVVAGREEIIPGLGEAVIGMKPGEKKRLALPPDKAFGPLDLKKVERLPLAKTFPRVIRMPAVEYVKRFTSLPVVGKEVELVPYFRSRVTEVAEKEVSLEFLAESGTVINEPYGVVTVSVAGDQVTTTLKPVIGASFPVNRGSGIISAVDGASFTVDFNHPLAGKSIVIDVEALSLAKASSLPSKPVEWTEGLDAGLAEAKKLDKPMVLVLYADWCSFCKRLLSETMEDPRVKNFRERLVWVKVNSDKETAVKNRYAQEGYPLVVLLRPDGTVAEKIDGFRDGEALSRTLKNFLAVQGKVAQGMK